jgi:hypothetical protein
MANTGMAMRRVGKTIGVYPNRPHPAVAAVPPKAAASLRMQRAAPQSCRAPARFDKVPLAGNGRWKTYHHSVAGRVRARQRSGPTFSGDQLSAAQPLRKKDRLTFPVSAPIPPHPTSPKTERVTPLDHGAV